MPRRKPVRILITVEVDNPTDEDRKHPMGITNSAYEILTNALSQAGFSVQDIVKE